MSKKVLSNQPPQNPLAAISRRAPSWVLDEVHVRASPVSGCNSGSTQTSLQTSVNRLVVRSLSHLHGQERACSTKNLAPQAQLYIYILCSHVTFTLCGMFYD